MARRRQSNRRLFHVTGRVVNQRTGLGVGGLMVEVWDEDLLLNDIIGKGLTDSQGSFNIEFTESHFRELFLDRSPDLFFKVFRGENLIRSTEDSVLWNVEAGQTTVVIEVDAPAGSAGPGKERRARPKPSNPESLKRD